MGFNMELGEERATNIVYGILREAVYLLFWVERDWRIEDGTAWVAATCRTTLRAGRGGNVTPPDPRERQATSFSTRAHCLGATPTDE